jgi:3'-phosphoadenosine 5'-phosphosulfate sulfotransferase (PAPS reductase)/FAD synthetase
MDDGGDLCRYRTQSAFQSIRFCLSRQQLVGSIVEYAIIKGLRRMQEEQRAQQPKYLARIGRPPTIAIPTVLQ